MYHAKQALSGNVAGRALNGLVLVSGNLSFSE